MKSLAGVPVVEQLSDDCYLHRHTLGMSKQHVQLCPECEEPVGDYYPGAKVYHMSCLKTKFKMLRKRNQRMYAPEAGLPVDHRLAVYSCDTSSLELMTCPRCGHQDYQMEAETGLCLVCVGKELEC